MAGAPGQDVLQQTVDAFSTRINEYADGIAGRLGRPLSGTELSKDQVVQRWNFTPLGSTMAADQAYHQLVAQGMPPGQALDQVYPMRNLLIKGASVNDSIKQAQQVAGWAAESTGQPEPEPPKQSTLPMLMNQQRAAAPQQAIPPMPALLPPPTAPAPPVAPPVALPVPAGMS